MSGKRRVFFSIRFRLEIFGRLFRGIKGQINIKTGAFFFAAVKADSAAQPFSEQANAEHADAAVISFR